MKAVWISVVVLLLSVVELEAASVCEFACVKRNLTVTVDDQLRLYFDGIEITNLPNANIASQPDVVDLPCTTRLIAIHGRNDPRREGAGIQASTGDDYVLTNSTWKCSNVSHSGWEGIDFDDSSCISRVEFGHDGEWNGGISPNAERIWLRQWNGLKNSTYEEMDMDVYCRKRLDVDECLFGQPINECDPSMGRCTSLTTGYNCSCNPGYQNEGQHKCKDINECLLGAPDNECDPLMGECIDFFGGYNCRCFEGYANNGSKRCKAVSTGNDSTSVTILGVLFGISVLANLSALVLHFRKITVNDEGQRDVNNQVHQNDNVLDDELISVAEYEYPDLRDHVQQRN